MDQTFSTLFAALRDNPYPAMLAISILAIGWLVKALVASFETRNKEQREANDKHLETAMQVAPLAREMVKTVEVLERLTTRATGGA